VDAAVLERVVQHCQDNISIVGNEPLPALVNLLLGGQVLGLACCLYLVALHACCQYCCGLCRLACGATKDTDPCQRIVHTSPQYGGLIGAGRVCNVQPLNCRKDLVVQGANALYRRGKRLRLLRLVGARRLLWRQV